MDIHELKARLQAMVDQLDRITHEVGDVTIEDGDVINGHQLTEIELLMFDETEYRTMDPTKCRQVQVVFGSYYTD